MKPHMLHFLSHYKLSSVLRTYIDILVFCNIMYSTLTKFDNVHRWQEKHRVHWGGQIFFLKTTTIYTLWDPKDDQQLWEGNRPRRIWKGLPWLLKWQRSSCEDALSVIPSRTTTISCRGKSIFLTKINEKGIFLKSQYWTEASVYWLIGHPNSLNYFWEFITKTWQPWLDIAMKGLTLGSSMNLWPWET